jgi:hypothetical protein
MAALAKMFKTVYHNKDLTNQAKRKTTAYDLVSKYDDFVGKELVFPFNYNLPVGVSPDFATAQANPTASGFDNWVMTTRKTLYGFLTIDALAMQAARADIGAFLRTKQKETNELLSYMKMVLGGHAFWGDGAGDLAQIISVTGANPITSFTVSPRSVVKIHKNQRLQFNATRTGAAGGLLAAEYRVDGVNRQTGVVTVTRVAGTTPDPAANQYVYQKGSYDAYPLGVSAFIPAADPGTGTVPATLLGMTRTDDVAMKSGWRVPWQGSIEESAKFLCAQMGQYFDSTTSALWLSRYNWFRLEQELAAQGRVIRDQKASAIFGTSAILLQTPEGDIPVVSDSYLGDDVAFLIDMACIETHHLGGLIHTVDDDGNSLLRQTADDGVEIRFRSWSENIIQRPFKCGRFPIPAAV